MAAEGTKSRRRCTEYTKDEPTGQERSPAKSSSPFIHAPRFLSFVHSFLLFLFFLLPFFPSYSSSFTPVLRLPPSTFLREERAIFKLGATELYGAHLIYRIVTCAISIVSIVSLIAS